MSEYTERFVSDLVGTPNCWFSHATAHIYVCISVQEIAGLGSWKFYKVLRQIGKDQFYERYSFKAVLLKSFENSAFPRGLPHELKIAFLSTWTVGILKTHKADFLIPRHNW